MWVWPPGSRGVLAFKFAELSKACTFKFRPSVAPFCEASLAVFALAKFDPSVEAEI